MKVLAFILIALCILAYSYSRKSKQVLKNVDRCPALESQCVGTCCVRPKHCFTVELSQRLESQWSDVVAKIKIGWPLESQQAVRPQHYFTVELS